MVRRRVHSDDADRVALVENVKHVRNGAGVYGSLKTDTASLVSSVAPVVHVMLSVDKGNEYQ